jgi:hypothetical protein
MQAIMAPFLGMFKLKNIYIKIAHRSLLDGFQIIQSRWKTLKGHLLKTVFEDGTGHPSQHGSLWPKMGF